VNHIIVLYFFLYKEASRPDISGV